VGKFRPTLKFMWPLQFCTYELNMTRQMSRPPLCDVAAQTEGRAVNKQTVNSWLQLRQLITLTGLIFSNLLLVLRLTFPVLFAVTVSTALFRLATLSLSLAVDSGVLRRASADSVILVRVVVASDVVNNLLRFHLPPRRSLTSTSASTLIIPAPTQISNTANITHVSHHDEITTTAKPLYSV